MTCTERQSGWDLPCASHSHRVHLGLALQSHLFSLVRCFLIFLLAKRTTPVRIKKTKYNRPPPTKETLVIFPSSSFIIAKGHFAGDFTFPPQACARKRKALESLHCGTRYFALYLPFASQRWLRRLFVVPVLLKNLHTEIGAQFEGKI